MHYVKTLKLFTLTLFLPFLLSGCALNQRTGGLIIPNDPAPNLPSIDTATFNAASGQSDVTGFVTIYLQSPQNYIVRLDSISFPATTSLQMTIFTSAGTGGPYTLRSSYGSQNYSIGIIGNQPTFQRVEIRSPGSTANYAIAIF
jgi:hypothetical protein